MEVPVERPLTSNRPIAGPAGAVRAPRSGRRPARLKWAFGAAGTLFVLAAAAYGGGGLYFSDQIRQGALDAAAKRAEQTTQTYPIRVLSVSASGGDGSITLRVPAQSEQLPAQGTWGLEARDGGFAQITGIEKTGGGEVTRSFRQLDGPPITAGEDVRFVTEAFPEDPQRALGIPYQDVFYPGPLGRYPAWYVEGTPSVWAIMVHGNSLRRGDMLRLMAPVHRAGLTMLVIKYRNDPGAPPDSSGMMRYGQTEWQDLQAAVQYAVSRGARKVVLVGVSMGGGIVMSFLYRSSLAGDVIAVVLDSPMLDFSRALDHAASQRSLPFGLPIPGSLTTVAKWMASWRFGVDFAALDYLSNDKRLRAPILLFQGTEDRIVPEATSDMLAADRADIVTYFVTQGADHVDSWNLGPALYEQRVQTFLAARLASEPFAIHA